MVDVLVEPVIARHPVSDGWTHRELRAHGPKTVFEFPLHLVRQLGALGRQQLDPVVGGGVVRGRDDRPHRRRTLLGQIADPTRGQDPHVDRVDAGGVEPGLEGEREHRAGPPGVPAHQDRAAAQIGAGGMSEGESQLGSEFGPGGTADPVGAENRFPIVEETTETGHGLDGNC